jgi:transposase-like protein
MPKQYPRELRERAVRLVTEHRGEYQTEYAAIRSIAAKLGIATPETTRISKIRGSSEAPDLPVLLAILKLPTGAITAFLGILLVRGGFIPVLAH